MSPLHLLSPRELLHLTVLIIHKIPFNTQHEKLAAAVREEFWKIIMATTSTTAPSLNLSVSDPVSAMVCAALGFLSTPAGQNLCGDLRGLILDLLNHIHGKVPNAPPVIAT